MKIASFKKLSWLAIGLVGFMGACSKSTPAPGPEAEVKPAVEKHLSLYESQDKWPGACQRAKDADQRQSPIALTKAMFPGKAASGLKIKYKPAKAEVIDNGHSIQVKFLSDAGYIEFEKNKYELKQFHFHSPAEHTLNGKAYAMEAHFVHMKEGAAPAAVVLGFLIEEGKGDKAWTKLWSSVPAKDAVKEPAKEAAKDAVKEPVKEAAAPAEATKEPAKEGAEHQDKVLATIEKLDVRKLIPAKGVYFTYEGSLTTPDCSEIVTHAVAQKPLQFKVDEIAKFAAYHPHTNRALQPEGKAEIRKYRLIKE